MSSQTLKMGTRGSLLARAQSNAIARALEARHDGVVAVEPAIYKTMGDKILDRPLHEFGGKGLFTKEIEEDLIAGKIDFIVHSCKDVPVTMPLVDQHGLMIGAVPAREDHRDALVCATAKSIYDLPEGAVVGTGSLRRRCQLLAVRPDLRVEGLRGNIDTRLRKCRDGEYAAVLLAMAGLIRGGLFDDTTMAPIPSSQMLPAAGQGALLIQCRKDDTRTREILAVLNDRNTAAAVQIERNLVAALNGDCHSPIAALAVVCGDVFTLQAAVGARGGHPPIIRACASSNSSQEVLDAVTKSLIRQGAIELLETEAVEGLCRLQ